MNKLIFAHSSINSLRDKCDFLSKQIKDSIGTLMISETKLDYSFPDAQFLIEGYYATLRFDCDKYTGGIILYVREDMLAEVLCRDCPFAESLFLKINFHKRKWLFKCSYNPHKNNITNQ